VYSRRQDWSTKFFGKAAANKNRNPTEKEKPTKARPPQGASTERRAAGMGNHLRRASLFVLPSALRHPERRRRAKRKRSIRSGKDSESKDLGIAMKTPQKVVHCDRRLFVKRGEKA